MPKNIAIFSDGTGQAGGLRPDQNLSNVYKLYRAARVGPDNAIDPARQIAFYDAGLGTENDEGEIPFRTVQWFRRLWSAATGSGLSRNIADCYEAVVKHYEEGDRVFLFGFSRGAFTVRCVGGVMSLCGVPTAAADGSPLPRHGKALRRIVDEAVSDVYEHGNGKKDPDGIYKAQRMEKAKRFRATYRCKEHHIGPQRPQGYTVPHFIGVFDTVAAVGAKGWRQLGFLLLLILFISLAAAAAAAVAAGFSGLFGAHGHFVAWFWTLEIGTLAVLLAQELFHRYKSIDNFPTGPSPLLGVGQDQASAFPGCKGHAA
jgi:uncharacterized protein (DUF2235 family)